jgi:hypothetical protein
VAAVKPKASSQLNVFIRNHYAGMSRFPISPLTPL